MTLVVALLIVISIMLLGAAVGRPLGWVAIALALIALLIQLNITHFH